MSRFAAGADDAEYAERMRCRHAMDTFWTVLADEDEPHLVGHILHLLRQHGTFDQEGWLHVDFYTLPLATLQVLAHDLERYEAKRRRRRRFRERLQFAEGMSTHRLTQLEHNIAALSCAGEWIAGPSH